ncbi:flavin reductase family protein [Pseudomonas sp. S75]|uniref:flavin reductase family protein n=1 Tax=unclassified Pseudomonas TaxID=196821 RepID=UPI0019040383|nr:MULTISPECIES: flavin reductase family protein [unclassified Pseudomonas]MBJ9974170.1 flavin reductase family protein [Pseudomonas sp. S30]MBK0151900.1 flavin reductase family protein [Pseudomonas sp. S75]
MFYQPGVTTHDLPYDPFKSCVVPRPIGWISTRSTDGVDNLAPYSQFTNVSFDPAMVMFSSNQTIDGRRKDSVINAEQTGVFIWNMATYDLREQVNLTAQELPYGIDEFVHATLEKAEGLIVAAARVAASPVQFECQYLQTVRLPGNGPMGTVDVVFGKVIGVHIVDRALTEDGRLDVLKIRPLARLGYFDYTSVTSTFEMIIPESDRLLVGLEGAAARNHS